MTAARRLAPALILPLALGASACSGHEDHGASTGAGPALSPATSAHAGHATAETTTGPPTASASAAPPSSGMAHQHAMDGGPAPAGLKKAANPKFPVGTRVSLAADHMPGMKGAPATVVGAFTTTTYAVSYTPTTGGARVTNHKWVVAQELAGAPTKPLPKGAEVTLEADHMPGMKGAAATVDSATEEAVYLVDYKMGGMTMRNHKWVVESEIGAR